MPILDEPENESKSENKEKNPKDPKKALEDTEKAAKASEKAAKDLEKAAKDSEKAAKAPEKSAKAPEKAPKDPEKVAKETEKSTEGSNGKIAPKDIEAQPKVASPEENEAIEESGNVEPAEMKWVETADGQIEIEDPDDYLIYLEDILTRIHK